jgi:hypothetical protein
LNQFEIETREAPDEENPSNSVVMVTRSEFVWILGEEYMWRKTAFAVVFHDCSDSVHLEHITRIPLQNTLLNHFHREQ